jgi:predicted AAA+ superfamily ATPase
MARQLKPWHENISKRQVKSPKLYFRDSGLLHVLFDALYVVHSGTDRYPLSERVEAVPWVETVRLAQAVR